MYNEKMEKRKKANTERRAAKGAKRAREQSIVEKASKQLRKKRYVRQGLDEKRRAKAESRRTDDD